jgi:DNA-binding NarL/FixJ family response regulator
VEPTQPIRVLLVDDYQDFLQVLSDFLAKTSWLKVVGTANSGDEALAMIRELHPDLVVTDLAMPGMNGVETAYRMKQLVPPPRVVVATLHDGQEYRAQAAAVGADGFISKVDAVVGLLPMIRMLFADRKIE